MAQQGSIEARLDGNRSVWALVAEDTADPLAERVRALLSHDRRMVVVHRLLNTAGADHLRIHVGLRVDEDFGPGVEQRSGGAGKSLFVHTTPGFHGFGFHAPFGSTETGMREVYARRDNPAGPVKEVVRVHVDGWPDSPSRDDEIHLEKWNADRVCELTTVRFQADWG